MVATIVAKMIQCSLLTLLSLSDENDKFLYSRESRLHVRLDPVKFRFTVMFFEEVYSFKPDSFSCGLDVRYSILNFTTQSKCAMKCVLRKILAHD